MTERYVCIHAHFYQPPRENPWLEELELQDSAYPYHDWNERITAECYAPNTSSRILDHEQRIIDIVNNYSKTSFNFGPTLLSWMARRRPEVYGAVLEADRISMERFSGHGSAIAQVYNHMIMPLAERRDKFTQAFWGVRDFEKRFNRPPEGMWLPETAVDTETLEVLAGLGIKFTILSPRQALRVRVLGAKDWDDVSGGKVDPTMAYACSLPSGKTMNVFFYDGPISHDVAFGRLLKDGEAFAKRLLSAFPEGSKGPRLVHIAADGETYGHHQRYGDMALAYCLYFIESSETVSLTNYGEYLEKYPPTHEVELIENSSWSCVHGVERWRDDCGCKTGMHAGWSQGWRRPLKQAMDWLMDRLADIYERESAGLLKDPWTARAGYIAVLLDGNKKESFLKKHSKTELSDQEKIKVLKLLEMQRNSMLMHTSCGWFFDEISGIETVQVMQYAAKAMQYAKEITGENLEPGYLDFLESAPSNVYRNGRQVYELFVRPAMVNLYRVGAHYAMSSLFEDYPEDIRIYCYSSKKEVYNRIDAGRNRLVTGKALLSLALGIISVGVLMVTTRFVMDAVWGPPLGVALLVVAGVLSAVAIMGLVGSVARTPEGAGNLGAIIAVTLGMLGGTFFPVGQGDDLLSKLTFLTPHAWFMGGLADISGGAEWTAALPSVAALLVFSLVLGSVAWVVLRRRIAE